MASRCARVSGAGKGPRRAASRWSPAPSEPGTGPPGSVVYLGMISSLLTLRRWLLGQTMPDYSKLATLATWLNLSVADLYDPQGSTHRVQEKQPQWHAGLGYQDRELFDLYLRLPVPKRRLVRDVILAIARAHAAEEAERNAHS